MSGACCWFGAFSLLLLGCLPVEEPERETCPDGGCSDPGAYSASFLTLRRTSPPDDDPATYAFTVDELVCTLSPPDATGQLPPPTCAVTGEPDDGTVPLFVAAEATAKGFGRRFRVDTMGRAGSHIRIERNGVIVDEFDHTPTFATANCPQFKYDAGGERDLPP